MEKVKNTLDILMEAVNSVKAENLGGTTKRLLVFDPAAPAGKQFSSASPANVVAADPNTILVAAAQLTQGELNALSTQASPILSAGAPYIIHDVMFNYQGTAYSGNPVEVGENILVAGTFSHAATRIIGAEMAGLDEYWFKMFRRSTLDFGSLNDQGVTGQLDLKIYMLGGNPTGGGGDSVLSLFVYYSLLPL